MSRSLCTAATVFLLASASFASPIEDQMRAVEEIRGLKFTGPVAVETLDRSQLSGHIRAQISKTLPYSIGDWERILRALLLIDESADQGFSSLLELYDSQVLAYYDPGSKTYFAVKQMPAAVSSLVPAAVAEESVAIHELTHALQDQRFDIGKTDFELRRDTDAAMAHHALLEGEATLVMLAYLTAKSGVSLDEVVKSDMLLDMLVAAAGNDSSFATNGPRYYGEMLKFPYIQGLRYVIDAYRRGGWKEIDRLHADPPRSTSELLHGRSDSVPRRAVWSTASPTSDVLSVEHLGEFHWAFLAGAGNARGWIDDRVTIAQNARCETTTLVETEWESDDAARRFHDAYRRMLDDRGAGSLAAIRGSRVRVAYGADRAVMERFVAR